jgi:hypothetical protein
MFGEVKLRDVKVKCTCDSWRTIRLNSAICRLILAWHTALFAAGAEVADAIRIYGAPKEYM